MQHHSLLNPPISNVTFLPIPKFQFSRATVTRRQSIQCEASDTITKRKPRVLCLHGFRTSGQILKTQLNNNWPQSLLQNIDFFFPDAPFPANGKSGVEGVFDPPYYEWFQSNKVENRVNLMCNDF